MVCDLDDAYDSTDVAVSTVHLTGRNAFDLQAILCSVLERKRMPDALPVGVSLTYNMICAGLVCDTRYPPSLRVMIFEVGMPPGTRAT